MEMDQLLLAMARYDGGVPERVQHFTKVHAYAAMIGRSEGLDAHTQHVLEAAAMVHDIGIKPALEQHGHCAGPVQEALGREPARRMLAEMGEEEAVIARVEELVGHHHTLSPVLGIDHQILLEADFLVNLCEGKASEEKIRSVREKVFKTAMGIALLDAMFAL